MEAPPAPGLGHCVLSTQLWEPLTGTSPGCTVSEGVLVLASLGAGMAQLLRTRFKISPVYCYQIGLLPDLISPYLSTTHSPC
jgi:hypothetical protein